MVGKREIEVLLRDKKIPFELVEHEAVWTIEEMRACSITDRGEVAKNLFLRDYKGRRHFLVVLRSDKEADLKVLAEKLGSSKLSFASPERLKKYLGVAPGAVTPFGVLNDSCHEVEVVFDQDLAGGNRVGFHPNVNTATIFLPFEKMAELVKSHGNKITYLTV